MSEPSQSAGTSRPGRVELAILALLILGGAALRLSRLGALPLGAAGSEEGTSWLVTAGQLRHWYPLLPSGITYWKGWPYTALSALFSIPFGLSTWSLRLPSALSGILAIPLGWAAARGVLARFRTTAWPAAAGGLLCAYLLAFSSWSVLMSRWGRFYEMGQMLFLAGVALAAAGFSAPDRPARWSVPLFGAVLFVAAATFHPGGILLLAPLAALALGVRFTRQQTLALLASLAVCALWFFGVLFLWKAGHVQANSGWKDLVMMVGVSFWKHILLLLAVSFAAWPLIVRAGPSRRGRGFIGARSIQA